MGTCKTFFELAFEVLSLGLSHKAVEETILIFQNGHISVWTWDGWQAAYCLVPGVTI